MKVIKTYELVGYNACKTSTIYCNRVVNLHFDNGNVLQRKNASLTTDNPFAQDAIEADERFATGAIKLVHTIEEKPDEDKKAEPFKMQEETLVVEDVKDLNDLDAWFGAKGVTLESGNKKYINSLCEQYNVRFPNLKMK